MRNMSNIRLPNSKCSYRTAGVAGTAVQSDDRSYRYVQFDTMTLKITARGIDCKLLKIKTGANVPPNKYFKAKEM